MKGNKFTSCDRVALSATFLRSIDPSAHKGWPSRYDIGKGTVIDVIPCGGIDLVNVWFDCQQLRTINAFNLVHVKDIYNEAMRSEHSSRNVEINS
jgi:hypothetical protein